MPSVDLGCGGVKRGDIGVDCYPHAGVDIVCLLGFEPIPLPDDSVDRVTAYDFLEHLPAAVWYRETTDAAPGRFAIHRPRIHLLREIHRILKPGGEFYSSTPAFPHREWAQDPTHEAPPWTDETWNYFCGGYGGIQGSLLSGYGIDFAFERIRMEFDRAWLNVLVRKPLSVHS